MSIKIPSKKHLQFTESLKHINSLDPNAYSQKEKEKLFAKWEKSYHKYINEKHFLSKVNKKSQP
tara:strand:- start:425 stop:616 length:192 start_codon:yes stop_codon:yes gene_type:complete